MAWRGDEVEEMRLCVVVRARGRGGVFKSGERFYRKWLL